MKIIKLALLVGALSAAALHASEQQFKTPEGSQGSFYAREGQGASISERLPKDPQRAASVLWQRIEHVVTMDQNKEKDAFVKEIPALIKGFKEPLADAVLYVPDGDGFYMERTLLQHVHAARAYAEGKDDNDAIFFYNDISLALEKQKYDASKELVRPDSQADTPVWKAVLKGGLVIAALALVGVACYFGIPYLKNRRNAPAKAAS